MSSSPPPDDDGLFPLDSAWTIRKPEPPTTTAAERFRARRLAILAKGFHPITEAVLHEDAAPATDREAPGRRCGTCRFRTLLTHHDSAYPKCLHPGTCGADEVSLIGYPYVTHGSATDVPAWYPGCTHHTYGDPQLSEDAARWVPELANPRSGS